MEQYAGTDGQPLARARALAPLLDAARRRWRQSAASFRPSSTACTKLGCSACSSRASSDGGEVDPVTFVHVIEEVAKVEGSAAWCLCQAGGCAMTAAYLAPEVAREVFGDRRAVLAWGPGPDARAIAVDGGYRVTGTWSFASGCRHATWLGGHCPILTADGAPRRRADGRREERTMLFPAASAEIVDVWHVSGLRGTGSDAFTVADLYVPHEYSVSRDDPAERRQPGPLYCFPAGSLYASGFAGVALGLGPRHARRLRGPRAGEDAARRAAHAARQPRGPVAGGPGGGAAPLRADVPHGLARGDLARGRALGHAHPGPANDHPPRRHLRHPPGAGRGGHRLCRGGIERHLHGGRLRATLPRHPRGDPAAPGPASPTSRRWASSSSASTPTPSSSSRAARRGQLRRWRPRPPAQRTSGYASGTAVGRRLASGPFSPTGALAHLSGQPARFSSAGYARAHHQWKTTAWSRDSSPSTASLSR